MRVLFINSVAGIGSTGRIAADQCRALTAQGHDCVLAYGREAANCDDIATHRIGTALDCRIHGAATRVLDLQGFASVGATRRFLRWADEFNPDVLWLHNLHGYYLNVQQLFAWIKSRPSMKVRWTLHDCWSFTGHCAYFDYAGCDRWMTGCGNCPQKGAYPASLLVDGSSRNYRKKASAFTGVKNMTLIVPSVWLADLVKKSFLGEYPVALMPNMVDTGVFRPTESDFRQRCGLEDKKIALCVANIWEKRKGLADVLQLSGLMDENWHLILVGKIPDPEHIRMPDNVLHIPKTDSREELAALYCAADVFVNPTYEDNYPTVNLEALACGTPVITYRTGGSPECLDETCGAAVEKSPEELWKAVKTADYRREDCLRRSKALNEHQQIIL